jgi:radical SAM-linked protein
MAGVFERAARRAGLPLAFTRGYHPKPRMRFSPALPLGAESLCEFLELGLAQPLSPDEVGRRLAEQLPPGFEIQSWEAAVPRDLLARIEGVRWCLQPPEPIPPGELEAARRRLEQGPLWLERKGRRRDLGRLVQQLQPTEGGGVEVCCRFDSGGTARPDEILAAVLRLEPSRIQRTAVTRLGWQIAPVRDGP